MTAGMNKFEGGYYMKRIGVLTFHRAINNGAVLQAYALTRVINDLGGDARYIDYTAEKIRN